MPLRPCRSLQSPPDPTPPPWRPGNFGVASCSRTKLPSTILRPPFCFFDRPLGPRSVLPLAVGAGRPPAAPPRLHSMFVLYLFRPRRFSPAQRCRVANSFFSSPIRLHSPSRPGSKHEPLPVLTKVGLTTTPVPSRARPSLTRALQSTLAPPAPRLCAPAFFALAPGRSSPPVFPLAV